MINTPARKVSAVALACLLLILVLPMAAMAATSDADQLIDLINGERTSRGLSPLVEHADLNAGAQSQAQAIADAGELFHNPDLGSVTTGWRVIGENVAYASSVSVAHTALMNSPSHRDNILNSGYTHVGVGVVVENNTVWVAEVFMESTAPRSYNGTFWDDDSSVHEGSIEWLAASGITKGCSSDQFCPTLTVTRGQMAAFIRRALGLSSSGGNSYDDDNSSIFESDIQALANAGIAEPCGTRKYCPDAPMTREMMAVFLTRALKLPASGTDRFTDDNNSKYEAEIQALAKSGITVGCSSTQYCPTDAVTREQMATFLMRGFG
ncbi:MAG: S-layer homology domain-containing protein [Acidimicrobiia bacterium]|nr:S-layer homology domain-containing protein [Acidimicrobiia bacterium]MDH4307898.1 S-layer homology domain-containing protein [Acidimicrobiia bacterium]